VQSLISENIPAFKYVGRLILKWSNYSIKFEAGFPNTSVYDQPCNETVKWKLKPLEDWRNADVLESKQRFVFGAMSLDIFTAYERFLRKQSMEIASKDVWGSDVTLEIISLISPSADTFLLSNSNDHFQHA
jgi:hypothetical protein